MSNSPHQLAYAGSWWSLQRLLALLRISVIGVFLIGLIVHCSLVTIAVITSCMTWARSRVFRVALISAVVCGILIHVELLNKNKKHIQFD